MQLQLGASKNLREVYDSHLRRLALLLKPALASGALIPRASSPRPWPPIRLDC